jgi:O-antigen ligase
MIINPDTADTGKERILYLLVFVFFLTLYFPFSPVVNNICIGLLFSYSFFFYNSFAEKLQLLKRRKSVIAMLLFYLLHVAGFFFSANRQEARALLEMRSPLLLFPLSLGTIVISRQLKIRLLRCFTIVTTLVAFLCLCYALVLYKKTGNAGVLYNDSLTTAINMQSIYFAMLVNLAIFSFAWLLHKKPAAIKYRGLGYLGILFLLVIHFMLASRIAIIILYSSLLFFAVYYIIKKKKLLEGTTLLLGLLIGVFLLVKFFPKTINRFRELEHREYNYQSRAAESHYNGILTKEQWNGANIRLAVWNCAWELFKQRPVTGWQPGDKQNRLKEVYSTKGFQFGIDTNRNTHNNYLDLLITFGIVGFIVFLLGYTILPFMQCYQQRDVLGIFIIAAFTISMLTENYMDRSVGNVLLSFFICFVVAGDLAPRRHTRTSQENIC